MYTKENWFLFLPHGVERREERRMVLMDGGDSRVTISSAEVTTRQRLFSVTSGHQRSTHARLTGKV